MKLSLLERSLHRLAVLGVLTLLAGCVVYPQHSRYRLHRRTPSVSGSVALTLQEQQVIRTYVLDHDLSHDALQTVPQGNHLPAGLVKKAADNESLPPGWESKLAKGRVLPLELFNQCSTLPDELVMRLPAQPRGTVTVAIDGKILRLAQSTREILDIVEVLGGSVDTTVAADLNRGSQR
jgi:hypothetical protein